MQRFVVTACPRSGSTMLVELLQQHPRLSVAEEVFHHAQDWREKAVSSVPGLRLWSPDWEVSDYLEHFERRAFVHGSDRMGFKLTYEQCIPAWAYLHHHPEVKIVNILRDPRDCYISKKFAEESHIWHAYNDEQAARANWHGSVYIRPSDIGMWVDNMQAFRAYVCSMPNRGIHVDYDMLSKDPQSVVNVIFEFLEVDPAPVTVRQKKIAARPNSERVLNYNQIRG